METDMIDHAVAAAESAFETYSELSPQKIAAFLERIAEEILALGDSLIATASEETGLTADRLTGERARTVNQLRLFAEVARDVKWKDVRIDPAMPDRKPLRRPDLRRTLIPIGPVAVWAASNFPLAFSVAGGDTASALAAGCPVILKAHPGHPKTSELVASAIGKAIRACELPAGVFTMVEGASPEISLALVRHRGVRAGAFTGSLRAGRALFDAANARPEPIPFFAEMGSVNPVFLLPEALAERRDSVAEGLTQSVNMGVGQFCTSPGLAIGVASPDFDQFSAELRSRFARTTTGKMLTPAIKASYCDAVSKIGTIDGIRVTTGAGDAPLPALFETNAQTFLANRELHHEVFGPSTILIRCDSQTDVVQVARALEGSLTATLHGTEGDLRANTVLLKILTHKVGRMILNGFPTGVEVCAAMQHGGPYPSTTDPRFTSVGTAAIVRFARPICYQDFPGEFLPAELR
jgi:alpha-ketoglutaric semialdehyde dehydrogenase